MAIRNLLPDVWRGGNVVSPMREMNRLQRRIDRIFDEFLSEPFSSNLLPSSLLQSTSLGEPLLMPVEFTPACDVEETDKNYLLSFDLPGIKKDEVKIEVQDNYLTVSGERKSEHKEEKRNRFSQERYYGAFSRTFALPTNVDANKVQANYENGVLQIALPKTAVSSGKQIPIKEGRLIEGKAEKVA